MRQVFFIHCWELKLHRRSLGYIHVARHNSIYTWPSIWGIYISQRHNYILYKSKIYINLYIYIILFATLHFHYIIMYVYVMYVQSNPGYYLHYRKTGYATNAKWLHKLWLTTIWFPILVCLGTLFQGGFCAEAQYMLVTYEAALFEKCKRSLDPNRLKGLPPNSCFPKPCGGHRDTSMNPQDYIEHCRKKCCYKIF